MTDWVLGAVMVAALVGAAISVGPTVRASYREWRRRLRFRRALAELTRRTDELRANMDSLAAAFLKLDPPRFFPYGERDIQARPWSMHAYGLRIWGYDLTRDDDDNPFLTTTVT